MLQSILNKVISKGKSHTVT